ncbi:hypothetical protein [Ralstonia phage RSP15]|uniref:portal protein n=1 Tax=Ralstonia phage RSP15 TaxID=1785960 RepID=UPI00074D40D8|nr:portal protein [Ralstonia phage RSP15]BAU39992.1 hypothetical protein [Ralstonia phage RSP15]
MFGFNSGTLVNLFGPKALKTQAQKDEEKIIDKQSIIAMDSDDPSYLIDASHVNRAGVDLSNGMMQQSEIINGYRAAALHHDVDDAIDDIVNGIVSTDEDEDPISLNLEYLEVSEPLKDKIQEEFEYLTKNLLDFDNTAYEKVRQFYVDGRQVFHVIVDEKSPAKGILKLTNLDPRAIRKVREVTKAVNPANGIEEIQKVENFYVYNTTYANDFSDLQAGSMGAYGKAKTSNVPIGQTLKIAEDAILYAHCGILDPNTNMVLGYLEKALRPLNQLRMVEDAIVVYRITRAPERRIFYIDVGTLPKKSAEEYVRNIMDKYRTRLSYDPKRGKIASNNHQISMMEDYWLPRREGSKGTEITTLEGGQNLGQLDDLYYLQKNLYAALRVPRSRLQEDASIIIGGRGAEITRDEWKFNKFINRVRRRYSYLFLELLRRQLILKKITTDEDWKEMILPNIKVTFASDSYMKEQQEVEALENKIRTLGEVEGYVGTYFSQEWVKRNVLKQDDDEIKLLQDQIKGEIKAGLIRDPMEKDEDGAYMNDPFRGK